MRYFVSVLSVVIILATADVFGRIIPPHTYDVLSENAELIVIARAVETKAAADKFEWSGNFVGQNTTFEIDATLKGEAAGKTIDLLHFKKGDKAIYVNGPTFVDFPVKPSKTLQRGEKIPEADESQVYLLFLTRMADGRYAPLTGHVDPALSIRQISALPEVE